MSHLIKSSQESHRTIGEALVAGKQSLDDVQLCTPRRALGDMKNVFATPMKTEVVKKNPIPENERRRKTFGVLCEKHPLGEKGDAVEVDVSEQQFRNVDPDAPVESFSFAPLPDTFEDLFSDTDNIVHVSEVLHDLHRDCNFRYALFAGLFTSEELDWLKSDEAPFSDDVELTLEDLIIDNV